MARLGEYYFIRSKNEQLKLPQLTRFGRAYLKHMYEKQKPLYHEMMMSGKLNNHLLQMDEQMNNRFDYLVEQYKVKYNVTEELKQQDQMKWVGLMNNIKEEVQIIIINEFIFC